MSSRFSPPQTPRSGPATSRYRPDRLLPALPAPPPPLPDRERHYPLRHTGEACMPPPAPREPAESPSLPAVRRADRGGAAPARPPRSAPLPFPSRRPAGWTNRPTAASLRHDTNPWLCERRAPTPIAVRLATGSRQHGFRPREGGHRPRHRPPALPSPRMRAAAVGRCARLGGVRGQ